MLTETMPLFELRDAQGHPGGTDRLWQQHEMLVAVLHGEGCEVCRDVEQALRAGEPDWSAQNVGLVFLHLQDAGAPAPAGEEAPIAQAMFERVGPLGVNRGAPCLAIADRYGQLYAALEVHAMATEELTAEARRWIDFIQERCEECGAPLEWDG